MTKVAVFGIGRVGLPLSLCFADQGCQVIGVDNDTEKISQLEQKLSPFHEEGMDELIQKHINGNLKVTSNPEYAVKASDYIVFTLGTPVDEHLNPDFRQIEKVLGECKPHLGQGQSLILRSTVSPGTTEYVARDIENTTNLKIGKDFYLAFCPERIAEGRAIKETYELPQIIGALDEPSRQKASELFSLLSPEILTTDATSAELAKLFCNMYRYINFAIGNEFMMIAEEKGSDIYEVERLVNHGYKRGGLSSPGFAAGPCLYKDGFFLVDQTPFSELITASWRVNEGTPGYLVRRMQQERDLEGEKVALLGMSFKADIDDTRNSLSYKAKKILLKEGAEVYTHDPFIDGEPLPQVLDDAGGVFLAMNHSAYRDLGIDFFQKYTQPDCTFVDPWNILKTNKVVFNLGEKNE